MFRRGRKHDIGNDHYPKNPDPQETRKEEEQQPN